MSKATYTRTFFNKEITAEQKTPYDGHERYTTKSDRNKEVTAQMSDGNRELQFVLLQLVVLVPETSIDH